MQREPWTCPSCGRTLGIKNQEHVCGLYDLEAHFEGKDPVGRLAFDWICDLFERHGAFDLLPMKTTIAFARGVNMAFLTTKRRGAEVAIVLSRPLGSPRVVGQTTYSRTKTIYRVRVEDAADLDGELEGWIVEAQVGFEP